MSTGARCEQNTFDGERCLYAANNREIRQLLHQYRTVKRRHDWFETSLHQAFQASDRTAFESDVTFWVHGVELHLHRFILAARAAYFAEMFQTRWRSRSYVAHDRDSQSNPIQSNPIQSRSHQARCVSVDSDDWSLG